MARRAARVALLAAARWWVCDGFARPPRVVARLTTGATGGDFMAEDDSSPEEVSLDLVSLLKMPDSPEMENRDVDYFGEAAVPEEGGESGDGGASSDASSLEATLAALGAVEDGGDESERVFCSRSLNLRGIRVIGYDMDYTIVHYKWREWELLAYECTKRVLLGIGFPVEDLEFDDADLACRGLVIDVDRGNFLKIDRHGFVRRAMHGSRRLDGSEVDALYGRATVDLRSRRFSFLNTLFSVSEGVMYAQLVSKLDSGALFRDARHPFDASRVSTYADLHRAVTKALSRAHGAGGSETPSLIKEAVVRDPARYTQRDPDLLRATLGDQRRAGKRLALITNSDWWYTNTMMTFVAGGDDWRDLFDVVIVSARKPSFFTTERLPCYEVVVDAEQGQSPQAHSPSSFEGDRKRAAPLLREATLLRPGSVYCGGSARLVEKLFRVRENELLYVGDHIFMDANAVKASMRWRTALVVQELEAEIQAWKDEQARGAAIDALLADKDALSLRFNALKNAIARWESDAAPSPPHVTDDASAAVTKGHARVLLSAMRDLDDKLSPLLYNEGDTFNRHWGYLTRAGHNDKSHLQRQIEKRDRGASSPRDHVLRRLGDSRVASQVRGHLLRPRHRPLQVHALRLLPDVEAGPRPRARGRPLRPRLFRQEYAS